MKYRKSTTQHSIATSSSQPAPNEKGNNIYKTTSSVSRKSKQVKSGSRRLEAPTLLDKLEEQFPDFQMTPAKVDCKQHHEFNDFDADKAAIV